MFKWIEIGMNEKIDLFQFNLYPNKQPLAPAHCQDLERQKNQKTSIGNFSL